MVSVRAIFYVFVVAVNPRLSTAMNLRVENRALTVASSAQTGEEWWPFKMFGGGKQRGGTIKQPLENLGDAQYFGVIEVGGQKVKAVIDTGSFELLVFGINCSICGAEKDLYNPLKSKRSTVTDFETSHTFGSGTMYSRRASDRLKIGGRLSIDNQSFWEVYDADMHLLVAGNFQSIFGVGPPRSAVQLAKNDAKEVRKEVKHLKRSGGKVTESVQEIVQHDDDTFDMMKKSTSVPENLKIINMSVCLGQDSGSEGWFFWDDHATQDSPDKFTSVSVNGDYHWSTPLGDVHLAGTPNPSANSTRQLNKLAHKSMDLGCDSKKCSAIFDTGTSLLAAPSSVVDALYDLADEWEAAGGNCDDLSQLPEFRFKLDGKDFSLPPEAYMGELNGRRGEDAVLIAKYMPRFFDKHKKLKHVRALNKKTMQADDDSDFAEDSFTLCQPLVMSMDADSNAGQVWILGMPFFRKYYSSFQFAQVKGKEPKAASMSFSEQDGTCSPGNAPAAFKNQHAQTMAKLYSSESATAKQRPAQIKIDASSILVPSLIKRAERTMKMSKATRPFVHV